MTLLDQAQQLLAELPYTEQTAERLAELERAATGEEAERIGELWEAFIAAADEDLLNRIDPMEP